MDPQRLFSAATAWLEALRDDQLVARFRGRPGCPAVGGLSESRWERVEGGLAVAAVAERFARARGAAPGAAGEPARLVFRAVAACYLERAGSDAEREIGRQLGLQGRPPEGHEAKLAGTAELQERDRWLERWRRDEQDLEGPRQERRAARRTAALRAGSTSTWEFLRATESVPPEALVLGFERGAIAPLDDAVAEAVGLLDAAHGRIEDGLLVEADVPAATLGDPAGGGIDGRRIAETLQRLDAWLQPSRSDSSPLWVGSAGDAAWPEVRESAERGALILLGTLEGPVAWARALQAFGRAAHRRFLAGRPQGSIRDAVDPAFAAAAATLFGRLVLNRRFVSRFARSGSEEILVPARLDLAMAPRRCWAYLAFGCSGEEMPSPRFDEVFRRAVRRPSLPAHRLEAFEPRPSTASELRGAVLGLLLEEQLLTRFGRGWFADARARAWLREIWDGEIGETAETVAGAVGAGTIEPTPIVDRCRPL